MEQTLQIGEILDAFKYTHDEYKKAEVEAAISLKGEITPHLIRILENVLADPEVYTEDQDLFDHIYALMLLGHFKETAAHRLIVDLFSLPSDIPEQLFGDIGLSYLPNILLATCDDSLEQIKALAAKRDADVYVRTSALNALAFAVPEGLADRVEVLNFFASLFTADAADDTDFWSLMAEFALDLHPVEIIDTIRRAYDEGLIYPGMIRIEHFERELAGPPEKGLQRLGEGHRNFSLDDLHAAIAPYVGSEGDPDSRSGHNALPEKGSLDKATRKKKEAAKKKRKMAKASKRKNRR